MKNLFKDGLTDDNFCLSVGFSIKSFIVYLRPTLEMVKPMEDVWRQDLWGLK